MSMSQAAQAVQRSAYPNAYAKHIGLVRSIFPKIQARAGQHVQDMNGQPYAITDPYTVDTPDLTYQASQPVGADFMPTSPVSAVQTDPLAAANEAIAPPDMSPLSANYGKPQDQPTIPSMPGTPTPDTGVQAWSTLIGPHTNQSLADSGAFGFQRGHDGSRNAIVQAAESLIGTPYVWGGNGKGGVDCSGLVAYAYAHGAGRTLPRISYQQANSGHRVGLGALRPGDLVAWDNSPRNPGADHIAVYAGNGYIIEAARPGTLVRRRKLGHNEGAWGVRMS
jgi:cell wall-associated NlpC family hydrolase